MGDGNDIRDPSKASRKGHQKKCPKCLGVGHNYLSCKNPIHKNSKHNKGKERTKAEIQSSANDIVLGGHPSNSTVVPPKRKLPIVRTRQKSQPIRSNIMWCHHQAQPQQLLHQAL